LDQVFKLDIYNVKTRAYLVSAGVHALTLFLNVETEVLEEDDGAWSRVGTRSLDLGPDAVIQERHVPRGLSTSHTISRLFVNLLVNSTRAWGYIEYPRDYGHNQEFQQIFRGSLV
jgi:hypothetical protein